MRDMGTEFRGKAHCVKGHGAGKFSLTGKNEI